LPDLSALISNMMPPKQSEARGANSVRVSALLKEASALRGEALGNFIGNLCGRLIDEGSLQVSLEVAEQGLALAEKQEFEPAIQSRISFKRRFREPHSVTRALELLLAVPEGGDPERSSLASRLLALVDSEAPPDPGDRTPLGRIAALAQSRRLRPGS
jgi:hypothetical protein